MKLNKKELQYLIECMDVVLYNVICFEDGGINQVYIDFGGDKKTNRLRNKLEKEIGKKDDK